MVETQEDQMKGMVASMDRQGEIFLGGTRVLAVSQKEERKGTKVLTKR